MSISSWGALADGWLSVQPDGRVTVVDSQESMAPVVTADKVEEGIIEISAECFGVYAMTRGTREGSFVALSWPESAVSGEVGTPQLPIIRRLVIVPEGATFNLTVTADSEAIVDLDAVGMPSRVYPRQAPIPKIEGAREAAKFAFSPRGYEKGMVYLNQKASLTELGMIQQVLIVDG